MNQTAPEGTQQRQKGFLERLSHRVVDMEEVHMWRPLPDNQEASSSHTDADCFKTFVLFFFIEKILFFSVLHPEVNLKAQTFHWWITLVKKTFQWEFFCVQRGERLL